MLKLAPRGLATNLFVFLRKKDDRNMMPSLRLMALPFAALLTQCAPVMGQPAIPNDGNDDLAALQQQIDETARRGGGIVQLEEGRYHVSGRFTCAQVSNCAAVDRAPSSRTRD